MKEGTLGREKMEAEFKSKHEIPMSFPAALRGVYNTSLSSQSLFSPHLLSSEKNKSITNIAMSSPRFCKSVDQWFDGLEDLASFAKVKICMANNHVCADHHFPIDIV